MDIRYSCVAYLTTCATLALSIPAHAEIAITAKSTWELCKNRQPESTATPELREQSTQELARRNASCDFLKTRKSTPVRSADRNTDANSSNPLLEQGKDLMIITEPRF